MTWQTQADGEQESCGTGDAVATTDSRAGGKFTVHVPDEASYCLQAFHPNWSRSELHRVAGADQTDLRLQLGYRSRVSGTVVDAQGRPLSGFTLVLSAQEPEGAGDQQVTRTDRNGHSLFDHLDYARYRLTSGDREYRVSQPEELVVSETEDRQGLRVKAYPITTVSGRVLDAYGQPGYYVALG